jgi:pimeloyl-ACP methyl ester carboxylesterase
VAPITWSEDAFSRAYQTNHGKALGPILETASKAVDSGAGETILEHTDVLYCKDTQVSAATFVSYYAQEPRFDTPTLIPQLKIPALVLAGSEDDIVPDLGKKIPPLIRDDRIRFKTIQGADHFFRDLHAEDVADAIRDFIGATRPAS